jgi:hypothetical protein
MSTPGCKIDWEDIAWEHEFKGDDREMLDYWYHAEGLTMAEIGRKLDISDVTISKRMKELRIEVKSKPTWNSRAPRLPGWKK